MVTGRLGGLPLQPRAHAPIDCGELGEAVGVAREALARANHMHQDGLDTLQIRDEVGIDTELKHRTGLRFGRELCVDHLVRPRTEVRRVLDPDQEVGAALPSAPSERGLKDHVDASPHEIERCRADVRLCDDQAAGLQGVQVGLLVHPAALGQDVEEWIPDLGVRDFLRCFKPVQR